jgi:VanZ family protein
LEHQELLATLLSSVVNEVMERILVNNQSIESPDQNGELSTFWHRVDMLGNIHNYCGLSILLDTLLTIVV